MASDENPASTMSVLMVTTFVDVFFLLGSTAVKLIALCTSWCEISRWKLKIGICQTGWSGVLNIVLLLEGTILKIPSMDFDGVHG